MNRSLTENQLWVTLPSAEDITSQLPADIAQSLLNSAELNWLTDPNNQNTDKLQSLATLASWWKKQVSASPGAIRIQLEGQYTDEELRLLYAMISRSLGYLNNRYTYFFDVQDRGLDYTKEAIPVSKTKAETGYHTDSTAKHYFPDIVGLLCLQPAMEGGESLLTNAANLYKHLCSEFPHLENVLQLPLYRDVITPGTIQDLDAIRANDIPLFQLDAHGGIVFRYMRYWIESALSKLQEPAPMHLMEALNAIDAFFARPENAMCFRLNRGDMLFVNNRFLCHNRTAFVDGDTPRVYVRAWINHLPQDA
jgi:hypothetical protein